MKVYDGEVPPFLSRVRLSLLMYKALDSKTENSIYSRFCEGAANAPAATGLIKPPLCTKREQCKKAMSIFHIFLLFFACVVVSSKLDKKRNDTRQRINLLWLGLVFKIPKCKFCHKNSTRFPTEPCQSHLTIHTDWANAKQHKIHFP